MKRKGGEEESCEPSNWVVIYNVQHSLEDLFEMFKAGNELELLAIKSP